MREIYVTKPSLPPVEEYIEEIKKIWERGILTNCGPNHEELTEKLKEYTGCENVELFTNGHTALECALELIDDGDKKGEVITTPFTFASTVNAIERKGFRPVFCDIDEKNLTLNTECIEKKITKHTKAIMPVHVYGNICDIEKIEEIGKKHSLYVIYDGAHAFGEKIGDRNVGTFGDITMFSFHATKMFGSGEGGALCFNGVKGAELAKKAAALRNFGLENGECTMAGGNGKMSELSAALGLCNLKYIDDYMKKRSRIYGIYEKILGQSGKIILCLNDSYGSVKRNFSYCPVLFENEETLVRVFDGLEKNNVHARRYFYPAVNDMKYYTEKYGRGDTKVCGDISRRILCLPLSTDISEEETEEICKIILGQL